MNYNHPLAANLSSIRYPAAVQRYAPLTSFDRFWPWVEQRHLIYENRRKNNPAPWCSDPYIASHKFCNVFRELDKESQFVIGLANDGLSRQSFEQCFFRVMLFRIWNLQSTWKLIEAAQPGQQIDVNTFNFAKAAQAINTLPPRGSQKDYGFSPAYNPRGCNAQQYANQGWTCTTGHMTAEFHFLVLCDMLAKNVPNQILTGAKTLNDVRLVIEQFPKIAGFVGPQFTMDLNYGPWLNLPHDTFCVAGPGAKKGVEDCFANHGGNHTDVIKAVWQHQDVCSLAAIGQRTPILQGRKPSAMNVQNFFCEFQKYNRRSCKVSYVVVRGARKYLSAPVLPPWW
jgi:alpha-glutamyl/putrescinyl thymine pyrophosphorylase clade 1